MVLPKLSLRTVDNYLKGLEKRCQSLVTVIHKTKDQLYEFQHKKQQKEYKIIKEKILSKVLGLYLFF